MKLILIIVIGIMFISASLAEVNKPEVIYKYKKYEKFDFEDMVVEGETGSPGDLSVSSRFQRKFSNKLPYRKNFHAEIKKAVERIR
ncbi:MAG: hypothetical protein A2202_07415 [Bdellovibrionales bacterium RIFOXYA1_FULL_36_14]|nr:MAG: hypothetical protein A2202_07415 [Bdellovibrionales bacterium RIFOXYA1_FULL_36_14]